MKSFLSRLLFAFYTLLFLCLCLSVRAQGTGGTIQASGYTGAPTVRGWLIDETIQATAVGHTNVGGVMPLWVHYIAYARCLYRFHVTIDGTTWYNQRRDTGWRRVNEMDGPDQFGAGRDYSETVALDASFDSEAFFHQWIQQEGETVLDGVQFEFAFQAQLIYADSLGVLHEVAQSNWYDWNEYVIGDFYGGNGY